MSGTGGFHPPALRGAARKKSRNCSLALSEEGIVKQKLARRFCADLAPGRLLVGIPHVLHDADLPA